MGDLTEPSGADPVIEVAGISKRYGEVKAVEDLSFSIGRGEVFVLIGPNGAGKTTTVEILEGFRKTDRGRARVLGVDPWRGGRALKTKTGVMLQEGGLYRGIRVAEAVRLFSSFYRDPVDADLTLEGVGLSGLSDRYVRHLSTGEKQRLALGLALIGRPEVAFLDEPTAGMDPQGRASTLEMILSLKLSGVTVLLTTQLLDEAARIADRVGIIAGGRLVALGTPHDLTARNEMVEFETDKPIDISAAAAATGARVEQRGPFAYVMETRPTPRSIAALASHLASTGVLITALRSGASLESAYLQLMKDEG